ncbi:MAG TPA: YkgJ family cysteine cluster protein [Geobacteraceae bacterium]|nr:YkgJ family cysteine cluster protein [Geobacteraceae bacterium]
MKTSSLLTRHFQMGYAASMVNVMESLQNYRNLVARVDALCLRILMAYGETVFCREGCDGCCRHISLFAVEAVALAGALSALPARQSTRIRNMAHAASGAAACPLLENGRCLLYEARPIICRTHGFPLFADRGGEREIDFCPKNFTGITSFPADAVLDLDLLNTTLAAINAVFIASCGDFIPPEQERISIAEALRLEV